MDLSTLPGLVPAEHIELRGSEPATWQVPPDSSVRILLLRQLGADIKLTLCGETLSLPGHRGGVLLARVDPGPTLDAKIEKVYCDKAPSCVQVYMLTAVAGSAEDELAQRAHNAACLFARGERGSIEEAETLLASSPGSVNRPFLLDVVAFFSALLAYQQFKFDDAIQRLALLSDAWWQLPDLAVAASWAQGAVCLEQYRTGEALTNLQQALDVAAANLDRLPWLQNDAVEIRLFTALVLMRLGRADEGLQLLNEGFELAAELHSDVLEGKLRNNYAAYFRSL